MLETPLAQRAALLRARIIETSHRAHVPHLGSCLSVVDILMVLYFSVLHLDPSHPEASDRDRCILSKGHAAPALFQVLALRGFFPEEWLKTYGENGGIFAEHPPTPDQLAGIEAATGSLGHGLPLGLGMALASRIQKIPYRVFVILSDGECNEGSVWEAALLAAAQKVNNLTVIIDYNKWQATGRSQEVMALEPLADKWRAFGWHAVEVDGHDMDQLKTVLQHEPYQHDGPTALIAHTIKGKGVSFMEDDNNWHYRTPSIEELKEAKRELGVV